MPANYRRNRFSDADESVSIARERHTVPSASPFEVTLDEVPREDSPSTIVIRMAPTSLDLSPTVDTYVDEDNPGNANASEALLDVGRQAPPTGTGRRRALLAFDLASVTGTPVSSKLRLWLSVMSVGTYPAACPVGVHRATGAWSAATKWGDQPGFNPVATDVVTVYGSGYYEFDVAALVAGWQAGTWPNHGLVLVTGDESESSTGTIRSFGAQDNATADRRPVLHVESAGTVFQQLDRAVAPAPGEASVSYPYGALRFHESAAGADVEVDYYGTGSATDADHVTPLSDFIGHGEDGDLSVTTGTHVLAGGRHRFGALYVAPGATLHLTGPVTVIGCTGAVEIRGTVDLAGRGYAGGAGGAAQKRGWDGRGFGGVGGRGGEPDAGGGGGGSSADGTDGSGGRGGDMHPSRAGLLWRESPLLAGGGGGGGGGTSVASGGAGGSGGGALLLQALGPITIPASAVLTASGSAGASPGGGGGAGGCIVIRAASRSIDAVPTLTGGAGEGAGGDGAAGWWLEEGL